MNYELIAAIGTFLTFIVISVIFSKLNFLPHITASSIGKRYYFLDGLRGLAAVAVINSHIWRITYSGLKIENFNFDTRITPMYGSFGVQIFFCITGFLFFDQLIKRNGNFDWLRFFSARIKRLAPLYIFTITVGIGLLWILSKASTPSLDDAYNAVKLYAFGFWGNGNAFKIFNIDPSLLTASIWTLPYEWRFYLLMPIFCLICLKKKYIAITIAFLTIASIFGFYIDKFALFPFFGIGAFAAYIHNKRQFNKTISSLALLATPLFAFVYFFIDHKLYGIESFAIVTLFFLSLLVSKPRILKFKPLVYLGEISYSVYLNHMMLMVLVSVLLTKFFDLKSIGPMAVIPIYILVSGIVCVASFFTFKYIEYPFLRKK